MHRRKFTRRATILSGLALAACAPRPESLVIDAAESDPVNDPRFAAIEARVGGRVGVAALNTANGAWLTHRAQERFAMCSTFKWLLAAAVLHSIQNGGLTLDQHVRYGESDLLEYAPTTRANVARGWMTVEELCIAAVELSDNTAANLLLEAVMGPAGLTRFLRANGDGVTRLDRTEPTLNENAPGDERDTTTPDAMVRTLARFLTTDEVLNPVSRERLIGWMVDNKTGDERLRAGLPSTWRVGDKTGSGNGVRSSTNDVAIVWPAGPSGLRPPILIASYISESPADAAARNAAHADIAHIIAETWA